MVNALFVLIVFLLQLNKDKIHVKWPLGIKTNITYDETTQEVTILGTPTIRLPVGTTGNGRPASPQFIDLICIFFLFSHSRAKKLFTQKNQNKTFNSETRPKIKLHRHVTHQSNTQPFVRSTYHPWQTHRFGEIRLELQRTWLNCATNRFSHFSCSTRSSYWSFS